ncbi:MAG: ankyrin repeat domain-containing protein [Holophaga sp.]|nr:ankyrin repeat domain-containing protein [Holophaga sp.]
MKNLLKVFCVIAIGGCLTLMAGTKLSKAAIDGDLDKVKACLESGEKINEVDKWGWTPLLWSIYYRNEVMSKWLLNHGADPNTQSTMIYGDFPIGTTPLNLAIYYAQEDQVLLLISYKADPSIADSKGKKPADYAKYYNLESCAAILSGTYKGMPNLHSTINKIITEKINDVFILIGSSNKESKSYLEKIQTNLEIELTKRKIRNYIYILDPMAFDEENVISQKIESFKPQFIITLNESSATITKHYFEKIRTSSTIQVELRRKGNQTVLWGKAIIANDTGINPGPFSSPNDDLPVVFVKQLTNEMEADLLI